MRKIAYTLCLLVISWAFPAAAMQENRVLVLDGNVISINADYFRLWGSDAPELDQTCKTDEDENWKCGIAAADKLKELVNNKWVECSGRSYDQRGFITASCFANGINLSELMVASGMAVAKRDDTDLYINIEAEARASRDGLWKSQFVMPEEWRQSHGRSY